VTCRSALLWSAGVKLSVASYGDRFKLNGPTEVCREETFPAATSECGDEVSRSAHAAPPDAIMRSTTADSITKQ